MAQNDFSSLALAKQCEPDLTTSDLICKQSTCSGAGDYIPVNFIQDEVLMMLKAWETTQLSRLELQGASGSTSQDVSTAAQGDTAQEAYEPLRYITDGTPPKRFFRTFWRSVARRALDRDREAIFAQKRGSALCLFSP